MFEPKPTFTAQDCARLRLLLDDPATGFRWPIFVDELRQKLECGRTVDAREISPDIATMHSLVRTRDLRSDASRFFVLVYPDEADLRFGRISVLSEVGTAILGSRAGSYLKLPDRQGDARLRLERVVSQPEANACHNARPRRAMYGRHRSGRPAGVEIRGPPTGADRESDITRRGYAATALIGA